MRLIDPITSGSATRAAAILIVLVAVIGDFFTPADFYPAMLCAVAIAVCAGLQDRRFLWALTFAVVLLNIAGWYISSPLDPGSHPAEFWINRILVGVVIVSVAAIVDWRMRTAERLAAAYEELDRRRREAEDASARKSRVMAAISHDVRTPAQAISLLADVMRLSAGDPERLADLTQRLKSSAVALSELLADVLDTARDMSDETRLRESEFPLAEVVVAVCRRLRTSVEHKGLTLRCDASPPAVWVRSDRVMLMRVLTNLFENAIKYTDAGEVRIEIALESDGSVDIHVSDTGIGVDAERLPHIFDEFFQIRDRDHRESGWGLGLATCKRLVEAMHGQLTVRSVVGCGTTFTISLPAACVLMQPSESGSRPASDDRPAARGDRHA